MAETIMMPQLGESVTEGTINRWLVRIGQKVNKYDPLCEVTTDKVTAEIPSIVSGTISEIIAQEGETVNTGGLICLIVTDDEAVLSVPDERQQPVSVQVSGTADAVIAEQGMNQIYSPAVWQLIQQHGLDPSRLAGTGYSGRLTRQDVLDYIEKEKQSAATEMISVSPIRSSIAKRMAQSKHEIPHAWTMIECDVTNLVQYRHAIKDDFKKAEDVPLTYFPFFLKAVADALKEFPIVNSQWAGDHIVVNKEIHLSVAVATDQALFAPVIPHADQKDIAGLARALHELVRKAREGKLTLNDLSGGTFTVNNTGSFGSVLSAPIINPPQAAIVTFEAIVKRPAIVDRILVERDKVNICLSLDHRILDGWVCGRFLQSVRQKLEGYGPGTKLYE